MNEAEENRGVKTHMAAKKLHVRLETKHTVHSRCAWHKRELVSTPLAAGSERLIYSLNKRTSGPRARS